MIKIYKNRIQDVFFQTFKKMTKTMGILQKKECEAFLRQIN